MLRHFFGSTGKAPDAVTVQDVFAWAYGTGLPGKQPGSVMIGTRIACLSSFYRFLIRMKVVASNPCDALERPKVTQSPARGLSGEQIHWLLDLVPATPVGLRDRAIILTLVFTGRPVGKLFRPLDAYPDHVGGLGHRVVDGVGELDALPLKLSLPLHRLHPPDPLHPGDQVDDDHLLLGFPLYPLAYAAP